MIPYLNLTSGRAIRLRRSRYGFIRGTTRERNSSIPVIRTRVLIRIGNSVEPGDGALKGRRYRSKFEERRSFHEKGGSSVKSGWVRWEKRRQTAPLQRHRKRRRC